MPLLLVANLQISSLKVLKKRGIKNFLRQRCSSTTSQLNSFGKRMQEKTSQFNIQTIAMTRRYAVYIYGGGNVLSNGYDWENLPQDLADVKTP